jgi:hypothetical protein
MLQYAAVHTRISISGLCVGRDSLSNPESATSIDRMMVSNELEIILHELSRLVENLPSKILWKD